MVDLVAAVEVSAMVGGCGGEDLISFLFAKVFQMRVDTSKTFKHLWSSK